MLNRLRRFRMYITKCARPTSKTVTPISSGDSQLATEAAVPPANPSRERTPAAVQLGTVATAPIMTLKNVVDLLCVFSGVPIGLIFP